MNPKDIRMMMAARQSHGATPSGAGPTGDTKDPNVFPHTAQGLKDAEAYAKQNNGTIMYYVEVPGPQQPQ